jgi:predicted RNA binding protein YcfA (HicA-like mRNA interferase family)
VPRKIRELEADLTRAGFSREPGKGSHRHYLHPRYRGKVTISGNPGDDAQPYQERAVKIALRALEEEEK